MGMFLGLKPQAESYHPFGIKSNNLFVDHSDDRAARMPVVRHLGDKEPVGKGRAVSHVPGPIVRRLFSLYRDLLGATGVCWHVDLFTSVCIDDLERGGRIIQPDRLDLGIDREGVSDG